jgi:hypothetical protein
MYVSMERQNLVSARDALLSGEQGKADALISARQGLMASNHAAVAAAAHTAELPGHGPPLPVEQG